MGQKQSKREQTKEKEEEEEKMKEDQKQNEASEIATTDEIVFHLIGYIDMKHFDTAEIDEAMSRTLEDAHKAALQADRNGAYRHTRNNISSEDRDLVRQKIKRMYSEIVE